MPGKTVCYGESVKKCLLPFGNTLGVILHFGIICTMKSLFFTLFFSLMFVQDTVMSQVPFVSIRDLTDA